MRFFLAGREGVWFFSRYDWGVNADRWASEHVLRWPADDRDVLRPAVSRSRNIDRPGRVIFRALNPRHSGGLTLLLRFLRPPHRREGSDPKDSPVCALSGVRGGVAADAV